MEIHIQTKNNKCFEINEETASAEVKSILSNLKDYNKRAMVAKFALKGILNDAFYDNNLVEFTVKELSTSVSMIEYYERELEKKMEEEQLAKQEETTGGEDNGR